MMDFQAMLSHPFPFTIYKKSPQHSPDLHSSSREIKYFSSRKEFMINCAVVAGRGMGYEEREHKQLSGSQHSQNHYCPV